MAAKELLRVRRKFVDKVNSVALIQILDYLLEDEVLNDQENESILEMVGNTADKARRLIDVVRKKGDAASGKMISHIQIQDCNLHAELFTQSTADALAPQVVQAPQAAQGAEGAEGAEGAQAAPTPHSGYSDTLIPTTEAFWRKQLMDEDVYPVFKAAIKKRVALLITNIEFRETRYNRKGAKKDEENMKKLLSALGYEVVTHTNLTAKEIDEALIKFSKHPKLSSTDSVIVVIMSHGKLDYVLGVNCKDTYGDEKPDEFPIDNICKHLAVSELEDKPKIIIIQACRGEEKGSVPVWDGANPAVDVLRPDSASSSEAFEDDSLRFVNQEKDFVFLLSSTPNTKSYRQEDRGSLLIQYVVNVFNTYAHEDHIEELFRKVSKRFESFQCGEIKQMATRDRCSLTRRFYLFPGI